MKCFDQMKSPHDARLVGQLAGEGEVDPLAPQRRDDALRRRPRPRDCRRRLPPPQQQVVNPPPQGTQRARYNADSVLILAKPIRLAT